MFRTIMTGMLSAAALLSTGAYAAEKFGTAPEAKALLERARREGGQNRRLRQVQQG